MQCPLLIQRSKLQWPTVQEQHSEKSPKTVPQLWQPPWLHLQWSLWLHLSLKSANIRPSPKIMNQTTHISNISAMKASPHPPHPNDSQRDRKLQRGREGGWGYTTMKKARVPPNSISAQLSKMWNVESKKAVEPSLCQGSKANENTTVIRAIMGVK